MLVMKLHKKMYSMQKKWLTLDIHLILDSFLRNGYVINPAMLGFSSLEHAAFDGDQFELVGDSLTYHFFENEIYFSSGLRKIGTVCKSYFNGEKFRTNALYLFGNVRLLRLMKYLPLFDIVCLADFVTSVERPRARLFMGVDYYEGALLFENGVLLQFSTSPNDSRNYFVRTVEGGVDVSDAVDLKAANSVLAATLYNEIVNIKSLFNIRPSCFAFAKFQTALKKIASVGG